MTTNRKRLLVHPFLMVLACLVLTGCPPRPRLARQFTSPCPGGQERVCLGRCAPASGAGEVCTPGRDECASTYRPCRDGLVCRQQGTDPAAGRCETIATPFCDPAIRPGSPGNLCEDGAFCARYGTEAEVRGGNACIPRPRLNLPASSLAGTCSAARSEGQRCDADWTRALQPLAPGRRPVCAACAPGLVCWNQVCRRPCRPEEGGLENCVADEQTRLFSTRWSCSTQTGQLTPSESPVQLPVCSVCVPPGLPCEVPPEFVPQATPTRRAEAVCCDTNQVCAPPLDLTGSRERHLATCCGRPARGTSQGGLCQTGADCCAVILPVLGRVSRCCTSPGPGCRPENVGRCAGCGPGTGVACCQPDGRGCEPGQTCAGSGDTASCIPCGQENIACCQRGNERTCNAGLTCFERRDLTPTGFRCERCGSSGEQCCPGSRCDDGHACVDGICRPCGERDEVCCDGRRCFGPHQRCDGDGRGTCAQRCGAAGLPCCGTRGSIWGPPRSFCDDGRSLCDDDSFTCRPCGDSGQPACIQVPACIPGLGPDPATGLCGPCSGQGQACCVSGSPQICGAGLVCSPAERRCVSCGGRRQPCCAAEPRCAPGPEGLFCAGNGFCEAAPG